MANAAAPTAAASATSLDWPKAAAVPFAGVAVGVAGPDPPLAAEPVVAAWVGAEPVAAVPVAAALVASVLVAAALVDAALVDAVSVGVPPAAPLAQLADLGREPATPASLQIFSAN